MLQLFEQRLRIQFQLLDNRTIFGEMLDVDQLLLDDVQSEAISERRNLIQSHSSNDQFRQRQRRNCGLGRHSPWPEGSP